MKLNERRYVSLSRDRRLAAQGQPESTELDSAEEQINDEEMSLFDLHMPGVMTLDEVKTLDLDHSLLLVQGSLIHMMVRRSYCRCIQAGLLTWLDSRIL